MATRLDPMSEEERLDDELEDASDDDQEDDEVDEDPIEPSAFYDDDIDDMETRDRNDAATIALQRPGPGGLTARRDYGSTIVIFARTWLPGVMARIVAE